MPTLAVVGRRATPRLSTLVAVSLALSLSRKIRSPRWPYALALVLISLNWRNLPGIWHARCMLPIALYRIRVAGIALGWLRPPATSRGRELGLPRRSWAVPSIGRSPFDLVHTSRETVGFAEADFNLHMSNSTYLAMLDYARLRWVVPHIGTVMHFEHAALALGETRLSFIREIPLFASYEMEVRLAAWDDRWMYTYSRFLLLPNGKVDANDGARVRNMRGQERLLATVGIAKVCCKVGGHRNSLHPSRVFAMAGMGPDAANWQSAMALRKQGRRAARTYLKQDGVPDSMDVYEKRRLSGLELVRALHDKASWLALDAFVAG